MSEFRANFGPSVRMLVGITISSHAVLHGIVFHMYTVPPNIANTCVFSLRVIVRESPPAATSPSSKSAITAIREACIVCLIWNVCL